MCAGGASTRRLTRGRARRAGGGSRARRGGAAYRAASEKGLARAVLGAKVAAYVRARGRPARRGGRRDGGRAPRDGLRRRGGAPRRQGQAMPAASGWRLRCRASSSPSASGHARGDAGRRAPTTAAPAGSVSTCATRAGSPSGRAAVWRSWRATTADRDPRRDRQEGRRARARRGERQRRPDAGARRRGAGRGLDRVPARPRPRGAGGVAGARGAQARRARLRHGRTGQRGRQAAARGVPARSHGGRRARHRGRRYPPGSTSFGSAIAAFEGPPAGGIRRRRRGSPGADRARARGRRSLAGAGGAPRPAAAPGKPRPRSVLLLSTANDLSPRLLQNAGRYVQGALLSPGFYADAGDARARAFLDGYRAAYGVIRTRPRPTPSTASTPSARRPRAAPARAPTCSRRSPAGRSRG